MMSKRSILMMGLLVWGVCVLVLIAVYSTVLQKRIKTGILWNDFNLVSQTADDVYSLRKTAELQYCNKTEDINTRRKEPQTLAVDHKHRLLYCPIANVASSFWKRIFQLSSGVKSGHSPFDIMAGSAHDGSLPKTKNLDMEHWSRQNYTSFIFVREPYSRLLACYIDKFFIGSPYYWNIGKYAIRVTRTNSTALALSCGIDVTFPEFIKFVIKTADSLVPDEHWCPMYKMCNPCRFHYDIIGKLETISTDLKYIMDNYVHGEVAFQDMESESDIDYLSEDAHNLLKVYDKAKRCRSFPVHLYRGLRQEQIRGIISKSVTIPAGLSSRTFLTDDELKKFFIWARNEGTDLATRKLQRHEALLEAYSSVPMEDLIKLQKLYKPDFEMFGYDPEPPELFAESIRSKVKKFYFI